jgi:hypothetical protein
VKRFQAVVFLGLLLTLACAKARDKGAPMHATMHMTVNGRPVPIEFSDAQIRDVLRTLNVKKDGEGFLILGSDDLTYLQVSGDQQVGFDMEYQEGDVSRHFRAERADFTLEEVREALTRYRDGNVDWPRYGKWKKITW